MLMVDSQYKMLILEKKKYRQIYELYLTHQFFYPLIGAVLLQEQDGVVYVNNLNQPTQVYVEHSFGFAQLFGEKDKDFELQLEHYLFTAKQFHPEKVRLYAPETPQFILKPEYEGFQSVRQRFVLDKTLAAHALSINKVHDKNITFAGVNESNSAEVEQHFNILSRFWRNEADFITRSNAAVIYYNKKIASICYSAAEANGCAEIDVLTLPEYRNLGLGKQAVLSFINNCMELSLAPLWDCFTNNEGSMMLCKSVGFVAPQKPYLFFTIK